MISTVCLFISLSIIVLALSQGAFCDVVFDRAVSFASSQEYRYQPKAAVVLAVRGSDPFLWRTCKPCWTRTTLTSNCL